MLKKILSAMLIGAFVFGINFSGAEIANAKPALGSDIKKPVPPQISNEQKLSDNQDGQKPPEPPKDADGNPLPPPDKQDGQNRPEPPKDANGKPLPPPDKQDGQNRPEPPKDADGNPLPPPDKSEHMLDGPGMVKEVD